jgi:large subunit ribosomal protein L23
MAFLGLKKNTPKAKKADKPAVVEKKIFTDTLSVFSHVLRGPRVTEKAAMMGESRTYTFEVAPDATKKMISRAIQELYKVIPERVSVVTIPVKRVFVRGKWGKKRGGKKAYVHLKEGDKIEVI